MNAPHVYDHVEFVALGRQKYRVRVGLGVVDGRLECVSLGINPPSGRGLSTEVVRDLKISSVIQRARKSFLPVLRRAIKTGEGLPKTLTTDERRIAKKALAVLLPLVEVASRHSNDRRGPTLGQLKQVAEVYRLANKNGEPPRLAVKNKFSLSEGGASKWISKARDAGLLGRTTKGKKGEQSPKRKRGKA